MATSIPSPNAADRVTTSVVPGLEPCAACGARPAGRYCHACGERRPDAADERLGPFLREQFREATSADGKLWRTLKGLFVPGKLTDEYFSGRRGLYVRPVRIFLVGNLAFFFLLAFTGSSSVFLGPADNQRTESAYGRWATAELADAAADAGVAQETYDAAFDRHAETLSTTLVVLLVPALALALAVVLVWRRAPGLRHLVFSTHYLAFCMAGSVALAVVLIPLQLTLQRLARYGVPDPIGGSLDTVIGVVILAYLVAALRRAYGLGWLASALSGAAVAFLAGPLVMMTYQTTLFVVTLWTLDLPA